MGETDADGEPRSKTTLRLMMAGVGCLLLPVAGLVYMRYSDNTIHAPAGNVSFERRETGDSKISLSGAAGPAEDLSMPSAQPRAVGAGSSLDFVKASGGEYVRDRKPGDVSRSTQAAAAAPAPAPPPPVEEEEAPLPRKHVAQKPGKKAFNVPHLNPSKGFTNFKSAKPAGGQVAGAGAAGAAPAGSMQDILKDLPPEYRKQVQGH